MRKINDRIKKQRILISDGAWGTMLHGKGLQPGECPELWNITHPDAVYDIAHSYIDAGSDIIETNTFGANNYKLAGYGLSQQQGELNYAGAAISRKAAGTKLVMGSVGPTGKMLITGEVTENDLYECYKVQCMALEQGGVDAIIFETMSDIDETLAGVKAAKEHTQCEVICTFTFDKTAGGGYHTMMGITPAAMAKAMIEAGVDIIGANCGNGIEGMIEIVKEIRTVNTTIPVLVHANAGLPVYSDGKTIFPHTPQHMAALIPSLIDAGASIIGGCCGTTPKHIREMAAKIRTLQF